MEAEEFILTPKDKLGQQLSKLGYFIAKVEFWCNVGDVDFYWKRRWHGRLFQYMMKCASEYARQERGKAYNHGFQDGVASVADEDKY